MAEKKSKSDKIQQLGSTIANIAKMAKHLANPVVFWTVVIVLIIILLIGIIAFFIAIAGKISGKIAEIIDTLANVTTVGIRVKDEEILDLCDYLEEMGYDLEGYGFVEEITRENEPTYDQTEYETRYNTPSKGNVTKVKSKYLKAYLIAEKKTYLISNVSSSELQSDLASFAKNTLIPFYFAAFWEPDSLLGTWAESIKRAGEDKLDYATMLIEVSNLTLEQLWPEGKASPDGTVFESAIRNMYTYSNGNYTIKDAYKISDQNQYDEIPEDSIRQSVAAMFLSNQISPIFYDFSEKNFFQRVGGFFEKWGTAFIPGLGTALTIFYNVNEDNANSSAAAEAFRLLCTEGAESAQEGMKTLFLYAQQLVKAMSNDGKDVYATTLAVNSIKYASGETEYLTANKGMIFIDDEDIEDSNRIKLAESFTAGEKYTFEIDKQNKKLIVKTYYIDGSLGAALGLGDYSAYMFSLNNILTKYGKPVEFLVAVHAATMAPDFTYKLATSPEVDTTVHMKTFETGATFTLVTDETDNTPILDIINDLYTTTDEKNGIARLKREKENTINDIARIYANAYNDRNLDDFIKNQEEDGHTISGEDTDAKRKSAKGIIERSIKNYINNKNSIKDFFDALEKLKNRNVTVARVSPSGSVSNNNDKINELKNADLVTILEITCSYNDIWQKSGDSYSNSTLISAIGEINGHDKIYQPYITKVEKHWYRNQYFTDIENDLYSFKQSAKSAIYNVYVILHPGLASITYEDLEDEGHSLTGVLHDLERLYSRIDAATTKEAVMNIVNSYKETINVSDEDIMEKINKEFNSLENAEFIGSAYKIVANPPPGFVEMSKLYEKLVCSDKDKWNDRAKAIIQAATVREQFDSTLEQIHNPLFEDNSQYIRSWLKSKYYIFDGSTNNDEDLESTDGTTTAQSLNYSKKVEGKKHINGAHALEALKEEMDQATYRSDMKYMLRDIVELFEDFEFDLINTEAPAQKTMQNIMPEYIPYTPWPSTYEKNESNCTKMIYKTSNNARLVAPASGRIVSNLNGKVEMEFTDELNFGITMKVEAERGMINLGLEAESEFNAGSEIGSISPEDGIIILKIQLFGSTKQLLKVEDYMTVNSKGYGDLTPRERSLLLFMLAKESNFGEGVTDNNALIRQVALANIVFNRISSPYFKNEKTVESILGNRQSAAEHGFVLTATNYGSFSETIDDTDENYADYKPIVSSALSGLDVTKEYTVIGATNFVPIHSYAVQTEWYDEVSYNEAKENLRIKMELGGSTSDLTCYFGLTQNEYLAYLGDLVSRKVDEVIYQLNIKRYNRGIEEFDEIVEKFKDAKEAITQYYSDRTFMDECKGLVRINPEIESIVTEISKSNLSQEIDGSRIIDKFTLTANSNYIVKWQFEYTVGEDGKISSQNIGVTHEAVENY